MESEKKMEDAITILERACKQRAAEGLAKARISECFSKLLLNKGGGKPSSSVFFSMLALKLKRAQNWQIDTMAVDGKNLFYNPAFTMSLTPDECIGVIVHEVLHCALSHFARKGDREHNKFNIAADLAINPLVIDAGYKLPKGGLIPGEGKYSDLPRGLSAEEYYNRLPADPPHGKQGGNGPGAPGNGKPSTDPGACGAVLPAGDESEQREAETQWEIATAQAATAARKKAKERGENLPACVSELIDDILAPKTDWRAALREFMTCRTKDDYSWARANRRFIARGLYLPSLDSEGLGNIVVVVDTSGSIDQEQLNVFAGELAGILELAPVSVTVLYHHTKVWRHDEWTPRDGPFSLTLGETGGTSHYDVFRVIDEMETAPACVVCLTDMESDFPEEPPYPVLWASTGRTTAPWGRLIEVKD